MGTMGPHRPHGARAGGQLAGRRQQTAGGWLAAGGRRLAAADGSRRRPANFATQYGDLHNRPPFFPKKQTHVFRPMGRMAPWAVWPYEPGRSGPSRWAAGRPAASGGRHAAGGGRPAVGRRTAAGGWQARPAKPDRGEKTSNPGDHTEYSVICEAKTIFLI